VYNYSFIEDILYEANDIETLPTPGLYHSAYVNTKQVRPGYPAWCIQGSANPYTFPFPEAVSNDWKRGLLESKQVYAENGRLLSEDSIKYDTRAIYAEPGYKVAKMGEYYEYLYARYYILGGMSKIKNEINRLYTPDNTIIRSETVYDYSSSHKKVTEKRVLTSTGDYLMEKYYYPTEYADCFPDLKNKHILFPIDIRSYKNGKLIGGKQTEYNNKGLPVRELKADPTTNDIPFNMANPFTFSPYVSYTYHTDNQMKSLVSRDEMPVIILWGYKHQYPIAEIKNATYDQIKNILTQTLIDRVASAVTPSASDSTQVNNLRSNPNLQKAEIITYEYKPLVGMTKQTSPQGIVTTYEYDAFGRLQTVKDHNGNQLEGYDYHYKTP
jgi:YD repeat-containing protein